VSFHTKNKKFQVYKNLKKKKTMLARTNLSLWLARSMPLFGASQGKVSNWIPGRGFGFIKDAQEKEHFVHHSAVKCEPGAYRGLTVGQEVEFDVVTQDGKTRAENVTAIGGGDLPGAPKPFNEGGRGGRGGGFRGGRGGGFRGGRGGGRGGYNNNRDDGYNNNRDNNNRGQPPADDF
jgi:cold shock CspA family protein